MTLGLLTAHDPWGVAIPTHARTEAVILSLTQCRCRGHAGVVLTSVPVKNLFCRLHEFDRPAWQGLRAEVDAVLRALPAYEIAAPFVGVADAPAAPPQITVWDL